MDWMALKAEQPRDNAMPARFNELTALEAVLDGRQYDCLHHPFFVERAANGEYVPLNKRRPSVRSNLCRTVVDDSASLLFSEGHWPGIKAEDTATSDALTALAKETNLNEVMLRAATRGSVGSVAILMRCLERRVFFAVMPTAALTPVWKPTAPDTLLSVTERRVVTGADLIAQGYNLAPTQAPERFWFVRKWDDTNETWFNPVSLTATGQAAQLVVDAERTVLHALGFVPIVWIRNLSSSDGPDGDCTFFAALDTVIEIDYLMSQAGRGLKYASDPKVVVTVGTGPAPEMSGGSAAALMLPPQSDAKLLEINGAAAKTVLEHVRELRAFALEIMHGNRSHADKLSAATSGRAMEMMMSGLIWLADRLRVSYGENGLLSLLRMICMASDVLKDGLLIAGQTAKSLNPTGLELAWMPWMPTTPQDLMTEAQALVTGVTGGVLSKETGAERFSALLNVEGAAEWARIQAETVIAQAKAVRTEAAAGPHLTHEVTA